MQSLIFFFFVVTQWQSCIPYPFKIPDTGRWVTPTVGQIWPQPQQQSPSQNFFILRPSAFQFQVTGERCDIIDDAVKRYYQTIFYPGGKPVRVINKILPPILPTESPHFRAFLDSVEINLKMPCEFLPHEDMLESYYIKIDTPDYALKATIVSDSVWGILRGLESFSQLIYSSPDTEVAHQVNGTLIVDFPRFSHRGLLIDTSRHFIPVKTLKKMIDLLAHNKMNVFHWHLTDDSAFSYKSELFPDISYYGAYQPYSHVYTFRDIRDIVEYARIRGIRVIPEFDTPGHTQSWGKGTPGLLTECYDDNGILIPNKFGPINPVKEENLLFLQRLFHEVSGEFPDSHLHIGGDEVIFDCWATNPQVKAFMAEKGWGEDWGKLEQYFIEQMMRLITQAAIPKNIRYTVWQEIVDDNATLPGDTVVNIWKLDNYQSKLELITGLGYLVLLSAPWYLNKISYGVDWDKYYLADPWDFNGSDAQKKRVMGGEAAMWSEFVDSVSLVPRTWPRASAVAERLWSDRSVNDAFLAAPRLEEHRCRLLRRGYNVDPINGANFCDQEWDDE